MLLRDTSDSARGSATLASKRRFIIFTCRDVKTDFRWPLAEALRVRHETWYIWLRRRPRILRPATDAEIQEMSFLSLIVLLTRVTRADADNIYLNSTNTSFPFIMVLLRLLCGRGLWCLDMHDDLLYDMTGFRRLQAAIAVRLQTWAADIVIRAAESLAELFPTSLPFGNASQIGLLKRAAAHYKCVLVLASLDTRFDFDFVAAAAEASPCRIFDIYGQISRGDALVRENVAALCASHSNVIYHGAYDLADLESILSRYSVSLAPYRTNSRLTRYLDPLRFYHCLNSGMELITTSIPQAERFQRSLHVVRDAAEVEPILAGLEAHDNIRRNTDENYNRQTWAKRAEQLIDIVTEHSMREQSFVENHSTRLP